MTVIERSRQNCIEDTKNLSEWNFITSIRHLDLFVCVSFISLFIYLFTVFYLIFSYSFLTSHPPNTNSNLSQLEKVMEDSCDRDNRI